MKKEYIIPIFVPHRGCPNDCSFCNQRKISGQIKDVTSDDVINTINYYLSNFKDDSKYVEVAFFGGSFTGIDKEKQIELLEAANIFIKDGKVGGIRISTRPDYINREILKFLKKYHVRTIELGVQSANNYVLDKCKRGHTFEDVKKASKMIRWRGFTLGHQMMVGLPESTMLDEINTAKELIKLKPKMVRIYPVLVIKDTQLERDFIENVYIPITIEQAVERTKEILKLFNRKKINVIRIGLQNTEEINSPKIEGSQVVAGPYHPAFRQLVESSVWYDCLAAKIKNLNSNVRQVEIIANDININNIIGHKRENVEKIKDFYDVDIIVKINNNILPGKFEINIIKTHFDFIENK
ncbi:MAG TPA: radical SAM protein [Bacteroidales bacterium]|nr:radical SAM protein [Bacteroidales bacterium]